MIDIFNLPSNEQNSKIYYALSSGSTKWQTWQKPNGAKMVHIYVLGGGGGGGGGRTGAVNTGTGGGGGGSTAISIGLFPACMLPDILYISVGKGGAGGAANTSGTAGELSYVSVSASTLSAATVMQSGAAGAGGGGAGGSSVAGTAGVAGTIWTYTSTIWAQLGQITPTVGHAGTLGGSTVGAGVNLTLQNVVSGGAGGGGESSNASSFKGGDITSTLYGFTTLNGGVANAADSTIHGNHGYSYSFPSSNSFSRGPMLFTGGAGGGGANTTSRDGGRGGNGSYGSGGGGGGAAYGGTGGRGGDGGGGLVIITTW
jgi:hypothetical protein